MKFKLHKKYTKPIAILMKGIFSTKILLKNLKPKELKINLDKKEIEVR